jgi:hypothetical protein
MAQQPLHLQRQKALRNTRGYLQPDTKFSEEGEYKVNLILPKQEAIPILKQINEVFAKNVEAEIKES